MVRLFLSFIMLNSSDSAPIKTPQAPVACFLHLLLLKTSVVIWKRRPHLCLGRATFSTPNGQYKVALPVQKKQLHQICASGLSYPLKIHNTRLVCFYSEPNPWIFNDVPATSVLDFLNVKQVYLFKKQPTTQPYFLPSHEMSVFKTLPDLPHVSACFFALQARFKSVLAVKTEQKDSHVSRDALCSKS